MNLMAAFGLKCIRMTAKCQGRSQVGRLPGPQLGSVAWDTPKLVVDSEAVSYGHW